MAEVVAAEGVVLREVGAAVVAAAEGVIVLREVGAAEVVMVG